MQPFKMDRIKVNQHFYHILKFEWKICTTCVCVSVSEIYVLVSKKIPLWSCSRKAAEDRWMDLICQVYCIFSSTVISLHERMNLAKCTDVCASDGIISYVWCSDVCNGVVLYSFCHQVAPLSKSSGLWHKRCNTKTLCFAFQTKKQQFLRANIYVKLFC